MVQDLIRYDVLAQEALRGVVRKVLMEVARAGLPGDHHFYIAFDTNAPGVRISSRLRERYPEEMTIVLQHQFWDLQVTEHAFEVGLSFAGVPERLLVPFSALKGFFDPSVEFGLQFNAMHEEPDEAADVNDAADPAATIAPVVPVPQPRQPSDPTAPASGEAPAEDDGKAPSDKTAAVVSLDAFRKKP
ncbi:SspB family protein [Chthonobacter rhizosphaerae]|uniref:SspB family protein n=1 Tax=Chthonobacter rhizosphaerae TaxID=2735553 RepID=UPI0015EEF68D|nr:SspB family protein [Chthonobacter rhizosphaerae]